MKNNLSLGSLYLLSLTVLIMLASCSQKVGCYYSFHVNPNQLRENVEAKSPNDQSLCNTTTSLYDNCDPQP